jgi:hypothetical protein
MKIRILSDIYLEVQRDIVLKLVTNDDNPNAVLFIAWCKEYMKQAGVRHGRSEELTEGK